MIWQNRSAAGFANPSLRFGRRKPSYQTPKHYGLDGKSRPAALVYLAQKLDVAEELDRLDAHIAETLKTLRQPEPSGRRLDFLLQEMNREANTLGSKSADTETTRASVELKVLIEQMREQIQNIE